MRMTNIYVGVVIMSSENDVYSVLSSLKMREATNTLVEIWRSQGKNVYTFSDALMTRLLEAYNTTDALMRLRKAGGLQRLPFKSFVIRNLARGLTAAEQKEISTITSAIFDGCVNCLVAVEGNRICIQVFMSEARETKHTPIFLFDVDFCEEGFKYIPCISEELYQVMCQNGFLNVLSGMGALLLIAALDAVLYLSAENADIQRIPQAKSKSHNTGKRPLKMRTFAVGSRAYLASNIRNGYSVGVSSNRQSSISGNSVAGHGKGVSKAPHTRRAHFHLYHTNNGDILRWLDPILINGGDPDTTVMHKVK